MLATCHPPQVLAALERLAGGQGGEEAREWARCAAAGASSVNPQPTPLGRAGWLAALLTPPLVMPPAGCREQHGCACEAASGLAVTAQSTELWLLLAAEGAAPPAALSAFVSAAIAAIDRTAVRPRVWGGGLQPAGCFRARRYLRHTFFLSHAAHSLGLPCPQDAGRQQRGVRLLCALLGRLADARPAALLGLAPEAQAFCIQHSRVQEAANLFQRLKSLEGD